MNCKDPYRKEQLNIGYKTLKREITTASRTSKKEYYSQYFTANTKNLQKIWKGIKEIINIKTKNFISCMHNRTITDPKKLPTHLTHIT